MISLLAIPVRIGSADALPFPAHPAPVRAITAVATPVGQVAVPHGGSFRLVSVDLHAAPVAVEGLPESGDIIVPAIVADAMSALGIRHEGLVFTPQMLREQDGVRYSPGLILRGDASSHFALGVYARQLADAVQASGLSYHDAHAATQAIQTA